MSLNIEARLKELEDRVFLIEKLYAGPAVFPFTPEVGSTTEYERMLQASIEHDRKQADEPCVTTAKDQEC